MLELDLKQFFTQCGEVVLLHVCEARNPSSVDKQRVFV